MNRRILLLLCLLAPATHAQVNGRVSVGTLAVRPAVCSAGDLYVGSDTNLIYQCAPGNAWTTVPNLNAANAFTGDNTHSGTETFSGGSPWFDVTGAQFGAKCDGSTPDDSAIQAALNAANAQGGGTVFSPPGKTCVIESNLSENGFKGVKVIGGFGTAMFVGNKQATWKFTGTCESGPCLSIRHTGYVSFNNIALSFSGITTANPGAIGITSSSVIVFAGVAIGGPKKSTICPLVALPEATNEILFGPHTSFSDAGCFVQGPTDNKKLNDNTVFDKVLFENPTIAAIENASSNWIVRDSVYQMFQPGSICTPFLTYVNGYIEASNFLAEGSIFNSTGGNCINTFSVFTFPSITEPPGVGALGCATFTNNLFIPGTKAGHQTEITAGDDQCIVAHGNVFQNVGTAYSFGTRVTQTIGANIYHNVATIGNAVPVANLPSAALNPGISIPVSDSTTISAEGQTCAGSSNNNAIATSDGTTWKCF